MTTKAPEDATAKEKTVEYIVKGRIRHNGIMHDKTIHLTDEEAAPLIAKGCIAEPA